MSSAAAPHRPRVEVCAHCGDECAADLIRSDAGVFCCSGCAAVYGMLARHQLDGFYACDVAPGVSQKDADSRRPDRFAALDDAAVQARLLDYADERRATVTLAIPGIHCGSCVWLLERLWRFDEGISASEVDLVRRSVRVEFDPSVTSLRRVAELLARIGYEPAIASEPTPRFDAARRRLYQQLGVAGFAFGNIMLFSIPRYANGVPVGDGLQRVFDALNLAFALPVLFFSAADYFRGAWHSVRTRTMTLDVPVALGLLALFGRSVFDIAEGREGFLDSFAGLVFFLLIGRLLQQKVFERISFERTFRSFLPLSVRVERGDALVLTPIDDLQAGDAIVVAGDEVVPADAELLDESAAVDYAFITGEQAPVRVRRGDVVRAGGKAAGSAVRLRVRSRVSHTRLAALWDNPVFARPRTSWLDDVASRFGAWFTVAAVGLAAIGAIAWWPDVHASLTVATAVLIVACPCAMTLAAPITLGTAMGRLGQRGFYVKRPAVILDLSRIDTIVFDKTGTLTASDRAMVVDAHGLSPRAWLRVQRLAAASSHPASRVLARARLPYGGPAIVPPAPTNVREVVGLGICGMVDRNYVAIGNRTFIAAERGTLPDDDGDDRIWVADGTELGWYRIQSPLRPGLDAAIRELAKDHELRLLSGDAGSDAGVWASLFPRGSRFQQSPEQKLAEIERAQAEGRHVLMVGDGLNDAGAFAAASAGLAVSDATTCLAPACDAVVDGSRLRALPAFLRYARVARQVIVLCFAVSVLYNAIGLTLALTGALTPLAAAILMPISSLTVVGISAGAMRWAAAGLLPS